MVVYFTKPWWYFIYLMVFLFYLVLCVVLVLYFVTLQAWQTLLWLGLHTSRWRLIVFPSEWAAIHRWETATGSFMVSFPLYRERGIPCSSLEWVTHLIGPSTARHFLNSASTVWTRARRWVKRLYSSHCSLAGADQSLFMGLVWSRHCVADCCACWGFWGLNIVCKALYFFFLLITCLVMLVTKSFRAAALVYKSDIVSCLIIFA